MANFLSDPQKKKNCNKKSVKATKSKEREQKQTERRARQEVYRPSFSNKRRVAA